MISYPKQVRVGWVPSGVSLWLQFWFRVCASCLDQHPPTPEISGRSRGRGEGMRPSSRPEGPTQASGGDDTEHRASPGPATSVPPPCHLCTRTRVSLST